MGIEKFVCPLLSKLGQRYEGFLFLSMIQLSVVLSRLSTGAVPSLLQSLMTAKNVPEIIIQHTSGLLIKQIIHTQDSSIDLSETRQLLSAIQQRHPSVLRKVGHELVLEQEGSTDTIEQLIVSLSMVCVTPLESWLPY